MTDIQTFIGSLCCIWFVGLIYIAALSSGSPGPKDDDEK